jgi:hypothetical protein
VNKRADFCGRRTGLRRSPRANDAATFSYTDRKRKEFVNDQGTADRTMIPLGPRSSIILTGFRPDSLLAEWEPRSLATRVLIADDDHLMRAGLVELLSNDPTIEIVGQASNGREAVERARRLAPDVVLGDPARD